MVLGNWYFCASIGLPTKEAAGYLDVVAALGEPVDVPSSAELVCAAVDWLASAEASMAVHALPHVLFTHRRFAGVREVAERASSFYRVLASLAPEPLRSRIGQLLWLAGSCVGEETVDLLEGLLADPRLRAVEADPDTPPYHDLVEQLAPTVVLAVCDVLAQAEPERLRELVTTLPDAARQGRHGRLALIAAVGLEAALRPDRIDEVLDDLARASGGAVDLEPDLLATAARVRFVVTPAVARSPEENGATDLIAADLLVESLVGTTLQGWLNRWRTDGTLPPSDDRRADDRRRAAYARLGGVEDHRRSAMPAVLWQTTCWELAAQAAPEFTAREARSWWQPPNPPFSSATMAVPAPEDRIGDAHVHITALALLRKAPDRDSSPVLTLRNGDLSVNDRGNLVRVWSPWMLEHRPADPARRPERRESPVGNEPEQLVRLLGAALVTDRLLATGRFADGPPDHLLLFVVHVRDVLARRFNNLSSRTDGEVGHASPATSLSGLSAHARSQVDRIGKGQRPGVHPRAVVEILEKLPYSDDQGRRPKALRDLTYKARALTIGLTWLQDSMSGGIAPHRTEAGGRWFIGAQSPAAALLRHADSVEQDPFARSSFTAALLYHELYGERRVIPWDWGVGGPDLSGEQLRSLNAQILALSGPTDEQRRSYSVEEWDRMEPGLTTLLCQPTRRLPDIVPITSETLRLIALLARPELGDAQAYESWVTSWHGLVRSLNVPAHLPRFVRSAMLDLFRSPTAGPKSQERLLRVLLQAVETIVDLSANAQHYYDRLFDTLLSGKTSLPPESANKLRYTTVRAIYRKRRERESGEHRANPFHTWGDRVSDRGTEQSLTAFLRQTRALTLAGQATELGTVMAESWWWANVPHVLPAVRLEGERPAVDPRLVVAAAADRRAGETVVYLRPRQLTSAVFNGTTEPVADLFAAASPGLDSPAGMLVLGIVCVVESAAVGGKMWINCGLSEPVVYETDGRDLDWRPGDNVAVLLSKDAGRADSVVNLAGVPQQPGEVRKATLRRTRRYPWLSLEVDGITGEQYPSQGIPEDIAARRRWDPDLSRAFDPGEVDGGVQVLVQWHPEYERWVPLDAGLAQLSVAPELQEADGRSEVRLVLAGPAVDRSGFGAAWRFVTMPGSSYVLGDAAWQEEDRDRLNDACLEDSDGLVVYAQFREGENRLRLRGEGQEPFDRRNACWLSLFDSVSGADHGDDDGGDRDPYVEAVREQGAESPEWHIDVPEVAGFPRRVLVEPTARDQEHDRFLCAIVGWNEPEARAGRATVEVVRELGLTVAPTLDVYDTLAHYAPGTLVSLTRHLTRDPARGENLVTLPEGLCAHAATDSLTLTGNFPEISAARSRPAVVVEDGARPQAARWVRPQPMSSKELLEASGGLTPDELAQIRSLQGMVASKIVGADRVTTHLRVWLRLPDRVLEAIIPVTSCDSDQPEAGDLVACTRSAAGWVFEMRRRFLKVRALWLWEDAPGRGWQPVGRGVGEESDDETSQDVYQHPRQPRLASGELSTAAGSGRAKAIRVRGQRRYDSYGAVQFAGRHLVGKVSGLELTTETQNVHVESTDLQIFPGPATTNGSPARLVDVHRRFRLSPAASSRILPPTRRSVPDPARTWELAMPGPFVGSRTEDGRMLLSGILAPDDDGRFQPWLLPVDEPATLVGGREYPPDRVRCVAVPYGRGARASHLSAPGVTVAEFLEQVVPQARLDGTAYRIREKQRRPYYAGLIDGADEPAHRFEFGYGWFLDIPASALTVGGKLVDADKLTLFHGDRIDALCVRPDSAVSGGFAVAIAFGDIVKGAEREIVVEARQRVVHRLDLEVDHDRGMVAVLRVHSRRQLTGDNPDNHVEPRPASAYLDPRDTAAIVAAGGTGVSRRSVLGRMEAEPENPGAARGRPKRLRFRHVPARPAPSDDEPGLKASDSLYLVAGLIQRTTNDYRLHFALPDGVDDDECPLEVSVARREFSHRENCLRRAAEGPQGAETYMGHAHMLVRLISRRDDTENGWEGSTKSPHFRDSRTLATYLASVGGDCFGVIARKSIEIRPGVLFPSSGLADAATLATGTVVRLERLGPDEVIVHEAIPADSTYVPARRSRPVVAFPKNNLRSNEDLAKADRRGAFTLAGLPGDSATASLEGLGRKLLEARHPKIVGAVRPHSRHATAIELVPLTEDVIGGTLRFDPGAAVSGVEVVEAPSADSAAAASRPGIRVAWAQLSFRDNSAAGIAVDCATRGWRYHDVLTRQWVLGRTNPRRIVLPAVALSTAEPVFFSRTASGWTLRHAHKDLRRFGFPAGDLLEEPVQQLATPGSRTWAVAAADRDGVWLELAPGRFAEIRGELVRDPDGHSLADLDWSLFRSGDLVTGRVEGGVSECGHLILHDWRPGVRSAMAALGAPRMLLPVSHSDDVQGALYLGEGGVTVPYPADLDVLADHPVGSAVWLNRGNDLTPLAESPIMPGDVVFVTAGAVDGSLHAMGLPWARVQLADENVAEHWPDCEWLRRDMAASRSLFLAKAGSVPVTVESCEESAGGSLILTVSRRGQPHVSQVHGSMLARPVAHLGDGWIAMRSGPILIRIHVHALVPALPDGAEIAESAAEALCGDGTVLRMRRSPDGEFQVGFGEAAVTTGETTVHPRLSVTDKKGTRGLICREDKTERLLWLPTEAAAWVENPPGDTLLDYLRSSRRLTVLRTGAGTVTLTGHPLIARDLRNMVSGQMLQVKLLADRGQSAGGGRLVSVERVGILASFESAEGSTVPPADTSFMAEVARIHHGDGQELLHLVEPGSRLTVTDLPKSMVDALEALYLPGLQHNPHPVHDLVDPRFAGYSLSYQEGRSGTSADTAVSPGNRLLQSLGALDSSPDSSDGDLTREAVNALAAWLCSPSGQAAALQENVEVDLLPFLAACRIGTRIEADTVLPRGWTVYLLARLGDRAVSSLHTEALATQWLIQPTRHILDAEWRRLRTIQIQSRLTRDQFNGVIAYGRGLANRPTGGRQSDAAPVARSLLAAVGQLPSASEMQTDAPQLSKLVAIGAGLRPVQTRAVPDWGPLPQQVTALEAAERDVRQDEMPLTLLPSFRSLTAAERAFGVRLLERARALLC